MRFRLGLLIGFGVGYVLGTKAGRDRYEQIIAAWNNVRTNDSVTKVADSAERVTRTPRSRAGDGMIRLARTIRVRATPDRPQPESR